MHTGKSGQMHPTHHSRKPQSFKSRSHKESKHRLQVYTKVPDPTLSAKGTKERKRNYSDAEASLINQYVLTHHDQLFGLNGQDTTPGQRRQLWENLTALVNSLGVEQRTTSEIKKRWQDVKIRIKRLFTQQQARHGRMRHVLTNEEAQIACLINPQLLGGMGLADASARGTGSSASDDEAGPSHTGLPNDNAELQKNQMSYSSEEEATLEDQAPDQSPGTPPHTPPNAWNASASPGRSTPSQKNVALPPPINPTGEYTLPPSINAEGEYTLPPSINQVGEYTLSPSINPTGEYVERRRSSRRGARRRGVSHQDQAWQEMFFRLQEETESSFTAMEKSLDDIADYLCNVPSQITDLGKKMEEHNTDLMQHLRDESVARRAFEEKLLDEQRQMREQISQLVESAVRSASTNTCIANALERLVGQLVPREPLARQEGAPTGSQWVSPPLAASQAATPTAFQGVQPQTSSSREEAGGGWPEHRGRTGGYTRLGGWTACTSERRT